MMISKDSMPFQFKEQYVFILYLPWTGNNIQVCTQCALMFKGTLYSIGQIHHKIECCTDSYNFATCSSIELNLYTLKKGE